MVNSQSSTLDIHKDDIQGESHNQGQSNANSGTNSNNSNNRNITTVNDLQSHSQQLNNQPVANSHTEARQRRTRIAQTEDFSLRTWIRNAPWSHYFKTGCYLIVKSPLNFFIFFCCLSVVVWGAFLVLLMGNMVKLKDEPTKKLWVEIASQVLNGFFTLANVPVHPKRFIGLICGLKIRRVDSTIRRQFISRFLDESFKSDAATGSIREEHEQELLKMLDFYRCFPEYGHTRVREMSGVNPRLSLDKYASEDQHVVNNNSESVSTSLLQPGVTLNIDGSHQNDSTVPIAPEANALVGIAEEDLHELLADETDRVVQSVVLPFLPFSIGSKSPNTPQERRMSIEVETSMQEEEDTGGDFTFKKATTFPLSRRTVDRRSSNSSFSNIPTKRTLPRTRARTVSMSIAKEAESSTFLIRKDHHLVSGSTDADTQENNFTLSKKDNTSSSEQDRLSPPLMPMPGALTIEQMEWVDSHQERLLQQQSALQKGWPWYHYTIPEGIEPVDFFAPESEQESIPEATRPFIEGSIQAEKQKPSAETAISWSIAGEQTDCRKVTIMLSSSPSDLVINPSRFCWIVGFFNINSFVQEILCGFMWGMNYHVRPGWVTGTGMAVGCLAAIIPSVMIMLHENAMSHYRVVATTEEAIQDALDEKVGAKEK
ncbi:hypothetical protein BGZ49_004071 [Haplosporangium sp. Z 27]|nr:hypothetical protein BGZ49_004071 [Haplosporangium sp. Z 27]